jgi:hypothetical protein
MLSLKRPAVLVLAAAGLAVAQPALTTIQDTLYRADGSRFTGTVYINWTSFQSGGGSNIATSSLTLRIVNGTLKVQLVPTTTATAGAQYNVRYNSRGINDFTEVWAVPPSTVTLRVRDVRASQGAIVGPPPVVSPVQIPDVVGLSNELALRPLKGVGFGIGRAAVINQGGQLDAASGSLSDCVRVDGTSGPCGNGSGGVLPSFVDEVPIGAINGSNVSFMLSFAPSPASSLALYRNGVLLGLNGDYLLNNSSVTFFTVSVPQTGDSLIARYRYASANNPLGTLTSAQVVCSNVGGVTSATSSTRLGTCTLPAGLLGPGDRIDIQFQYSHTGTTVGFTGEVHWGSTIVALRPAAAAESVLTGHSSVGLASVGQVWDTETWGATLSFSAGVGQSTEDITQPLTIDFRGQMASSTSDAVVLRSFTVVRYPAQSNP